MCIAIGTAAGPAIGSFVYATYKYEYTMYLFAFLNMINLIICCVFLPNILNNTSLYDDEEAEKSEEESENKRRDITRMDIYMNKHVNFALIT